MFSLIRITDFLRRVRGEDDGIALAAVMALMALGMLFTTMILSSVVTGLGSTTSTRAGIQSQASAESGIDVVLASLVSGTACTSTYSSGVSPKFTATISYTTDVTVTAATAWTPGCPSSTANFTRVTSVGTALAPGVAGNTSGNTRTVEAIYSRPITSQPIVASGPAVYAYSSQDFGGSGTLVSADGTNDANVMVKTGDVNCSGGAAAAGDLVVNNGNLALSGSCGVSGNLWVSGDATHGSVSLSGGVAVGGTIVAQSVNVNNGTVGKGIWSTGPVSVGPSNIGAGGGGITATNGNITLNGTNTVNGSLWSSGNISVTNGDAVTGSAFGQNITLNGGNVRGTAFAKFTVGGVTWYRIDGNIVGQVVLSGILAAGGVTLYPLGTPALPAAPSAPISPTVPNWIEFAYSQSDWTGFGLFTVPNGTTCNETYMITAAATFGSARGVIDARNCSGQVNFGNNSLTLPMLNDLAIISTKGFSMTNSFIGSAAPHNLWLIQPDPVPTDGVPTTTGCSPTVFSGGFNFTGQVSVMTYSPCEVQVGSAINYRGQLFSGATRVEGAAHLVYNPVGLPGWNLNTGIRSTVAAASNNWSVQSTRNVGG